MAAGTLGLGDAESEIGGAGEECGFGALSGRRLCRSFFAGTYISCSDIFWVYVRPDASLAAHGTGIRFFSWTDDKQSMMGLQSSQESPRRKLAPLFPPDCARAGIYGSTAAG